MAQEMGTGVGRGAVLLSALQEQCKESQGKMTQLSFLDDSRPKQIDWIGTRSAAQDRLMAFLPFAGRAYAADRNYDFGPQDRGNVSALSPWIKHRLITEPEVLRATLSVHSAASAEKFIQEMFWRTYFKGWLEQRPTVWSAYRADVARLYDDMSRQTDTRQRYDAAVAGKTGIDAFDAWALELAQTGYLHNHARMWFASIWVFTLGLPWQLGADFFYRHLLDGDAASNTLSWRWVSGLHTKGKTYLARKTNIEKYTNGRFSPSGLADAAPTLFEPDAHPRVPLCQSDDFDDTVPFGLVLTEEDCGVDTLPFAGTPVGIGGIMGTSSRSPLPTSNIVREFVHDAMGNTLRRAHDRYGVSPDQIEDENLGNGLVQWAQRIGVTTLVTPWVPVGPTRDKLTAAQNQLAQAGVRLVQVKRPYDQACWPHATSGFFKFKAHIPELIAHVTMP